jgi:hypothetical protein
MTTLEELRDRVLDTAQAEMKVNRMLRPVVVIEGKNGELVRLGLNEATFNLFNTGEGKDRFFGRIRKLVNHLKCNAVVIAVDTSAGRPTEKGSRLSYEEMRELALAEPHFMRAVREGYIYKVDALTITAQSRNRSLITMVEYEQDEVTGEVHLGERTDTEGGADEVRGRIKMFGDLREEYIG